MRRRVATLLALAVLFNAVAVLALCEGWRASASERMACCQRAHDGCADQLAADDCCARSEQAQQPTLTTSLTAVGPQSVIALPTAWTETVVLADATTRLTVVRAAHERPHRPPHLRQTALLI